MRHTKQPFYLRRSVLAGFATLFCISLVLLEVLNQLSVAHDGLVPSKESRHYLWKYGPTAIFSVITAFWTRTEYQSRQSAPWQVIGKKASDAEQSVLLDYVSVALPVALFRAVRNKHVIVAASITVSLLFRLLVIFSTGLLALQQVRTERDNVPMQLLDAFHADKSRFAAVGSQPYNILNGVLFHNLSYPEGTTKNLAFQKFSAPDISSDANISTVVDAFTAGLSCEPGTAHVNRWEIGIEYIVNSSHTNQRRAIEDVQVVTPSCTLSNVSFDGEKDTFYYAAFGYYSHLRVVQCDNSQGADSHRVLVAYVELDDGPETPPHNFTHSDSGQTFYWRTYNRTIVRSVQALCQPTYTMFKLRAEMNTTHSKSDSYDPRLHKIPSSNWTVSGLSGWDIANATFQYAIDKASAKGEWNNPDNGFDMDLALDPSLKLGLFMSGIRTAEAKDFFDVDFLQNVATAYYQGLSTQIVHEALFEPTSTMSNGTAIVTENRLIVGNLSLRGMEVCLALMISLVIVMMLQTSRNVAIPENLNSLAVMASTLSRSYSFCQIFRGTGAAPSDILRDSLAGGKYYSDHNPEGFSIMVEEEPHGRTPPVDSYPTPSWRPFPQLIARIVILVSVALVVAALETVLQFSQRDGGLGFVEPNGNMHFLWTLVPAAIMVTIALLFSSIDFNTRCLAPYAQLRRPTGAIFQRSMAADFLDTVSINNLFRSVRLREWAVLATTILTLIAPVLTVVASGLYSAIEVPQTTSVSFQQETIFSANETLLEETYKSFDGLDVAGLIFFNNLSYPQWTYEELAFPELSMPERSNSTATNSSSTTTFVDVTVPAARSVLSCRLYTEQNLQTNFTLNDHDDDALFSEPTGPWTFNINVTEEYCPRRGYHERDAITIHSIMPETYFGMYIDEGDGFSYLTPGFCSDITYIWGRMGNSSATHIALLACNQTAEELDTTVRFHLPSFDIDTRKPPVPDESTAHPKNLSRTRYNGQNFPNVTTTQSFDNFFQAVVYGKYSTPIETLGKASDNDKVVDTVKHIHDIITAQYYGGYARIAGDNFTLASVTGNVTEFNHWRLVQDPASTRALEVLLVAISVLGVIASLLVNTDRLLPKNPCSIAAVASYFADSKVLERYKLEQWGEEHKMTFWEGVFGSSRFYLGWSDNEGNSSGGESTAESQTENEDRFTIYVKDSPDD